MEVAAGEYGEDKIKLLTDSVASGNCDKQISSQGRDRQGSPRNSDTDSPESAHLIIAKGDSDSNLPTPVSEKSRLMEDFTTVQVNGSLTRTHTSNGQFYMSKEHYKVSSE